jgi:hypothetical protein
VPSEDVRDIGRVADLYGAYVTVGVDHDAVTVDGPPGITLGPEARDDFARLYFQADTEAKAWAEAERRARDGEPGE